MMEEQWKAAAMEDAQKVCDLTDLTTELAEALEDLIASGTDDKHAMKQAKAALKKAGR